MIWQRFLTKILDKDFWQRFLTKIWHHLQFFLMPPPTFFFKCWRWCQKNSNKKSQSTRAKCTSDLAWSVQTRSEIVRNCLKRVKSCPKLAKESQKRAKKESKKRQKNVFSLLLDNILYRKRTWDRVPTNPGNPTNLWLSYGSAEGRT